mmetsp:Transcript_34100/g.54351  ORF Transcript_34100/g.54351 Transcript_34100/m.54351 type:complete len:141 (+) Transcript_34100:68-490(+)
MAPKRRLMDKAPEEQPASNTRRRTKSSDNGNEENALALIQSRDKSRDDSADKSAVVPVKRGGGRGLKAVQTSNEQTVTSDKADGTKIESKTKMKEQKLYTAKSNAHVETKTVQEENRKKVRKDGTVTVTSSTTVKKVSYL